jgi:hypothetical protein
MTVIGRVVDATLTGRSGATDAEGDCGPPA